MKQLFMTAYTYRDLDSDNLKALTKRFLEVGDAPGVVAHYERLDGQGGFVVLDGDGDTEKAYEVIIKYNPWIEFETIPVTTLDEALPVILRNYG